MIESDTIVFEDLDLKFIVIFIVTMLVPYIFRPFKYLIFVREVLWNDPI